jgi:hypothetical protein
LAEWRKYFTNSFTDPAEVDTWVNSFESVEIVGYAGVGAVLFITVKAAPPKNR